MLSFPNCKINIGLNVTNKREDGYHDIETIFYPVNWRDILEINKAENLKPNKFSYKDSISVNSSGHAIDGDIKNNLCYKSFLLLKEEFELPEIVLHLHKNIPVGSGLGGGSSDGAFTLMLLNEIFDLKLQPAQLKNYASQLGSDCAFFLSGKPCFASGKGNELEEIKLFLFGWHITIVMPSSHISTAEAYKLVKPVSPSATLKNLIKEPVKNWRSLIVNDFEKEIFKIYPGIEKIKNALYESGCIYASMSGSGSSVYGISYDKPEVENKFNDCIVWQGIL